jgi:hypothetical protein
MEVVRFKILNANVGKGRNIIKASNYTEQNEILFRPKTKFKVVAIRRESGYTSVVLDANVNSDTQIVKNPFNGDDLDLSQSSDGLEGLFCL